MSVAHSFRWDVLGLGCVAIDDLLYVETFPAPETKVRVRRRERQCGGLTATGLVAAARLGARCAYAGVLGHDPASEFVLATLQREGIDTRHTLRREQARPIHSTIIVDETHHTRTIFFDLTGATGADTHSPGDDVLRETRVLYVDHYGIEGMLRAARLARTEGIAIVADLERDEWPGFHDLLALVDHLLLSQSFAARVTGCHDPARAVNALWTEARQAVIVTCGAEGCWSRAVGSSATPVHHPAFAVEVVDTTGCGDVFHGAYAAELARGASLAERIRFASATAALKARQLGAQAGIPTRTDVEQFLRRHGFSTDREMS